MPTSVLNLILAVGSSTILTSGAVFAIVKFLLKPIWTTLNAYATTYANGQASIDVRIRNLEKLSEEQARLTRIVESIKDEFLAEARSRDNRWAFRKDIYVNVIKATSDLIQYFVVLAAQQGQDHLADESLSEENRNAIDKRRMDQALKAEAAAYEFVTHTNLAHLAMADSIIGVIQEVQEEVFSQIDYASPDCKAEITAKKVALEGLLVKLCWAGRAEVWEGPSPNKPANV